jgi:biopolymer transport protein ExbB
MDTGLVEHQFSLARYWAQGDALSHAVAYILLAMSLVSWYFILSKALLSWRVRRSSGAVDTFWSAPTIADGVAALAASDPEQIYVGLARQGEAQMAVATRHTLAGEMGYGEQVTRVLRGAIPTMKLESGLTLLASIGATAPFVGLLGTVWGIYHALGAVSSGGAVQIDKVAGPVGEALVMTGIGLMVAIPAVLAFNGFNRVNRLTLSELDAFAYDLHAYLTTGDRAHMKG